MNIKAANIDFTKYFHKSQKQKTTHTNVFVLAAATTTTHDTIDDDDDDNQDQQRSATSDCPVKNGFTRKKLTQYYFKIGEIHLNYLLC